MLHVCFYTICLVFRYILWRFYAFSRTNLLTRCHSASSLFFAVFVFQKSYTGNILGIGRNKSRTSRNYRSFQRTEEEMEQSQEATSPPGGAAWPWPRRPMVRAPWSTSDTAPSPIKTPQREKPKDPITFPETYRDPPPPPTRDREGPEALPVTLPERGIATGGLIHRHACLRRDE
jgi:hypothetical protein